MAKKGFFRFKVTGLNQDRLIEKFKREGITLYNIVKKDAKTMYITTSANEIEKAFAITDKLCYNIKIIGINGLARHLITLKKSVGAIVGAIVFTFTAYFSSSIICGIDVNGDASAYSGQLNAYLKSIGVEKFTPFNKYDLDDIENKMLIDNDYLSFVSLKKRGARLVVTAYLAESFGGVIDDGIERLTASVTGEVQSIKVYRGTALVKVGDNVKSGDVLVDGFATVNENTVKVNVFASVVIKTSVVYTYNFKTENSEDQAVAFAIAEHNGGFDDIKVTYIKENGSFSYSVEVFYPVTVVAG